MIRNCFLMAIWLVFILASAAALPTPAMSIMEWGSCLTEWTAPPFPQDNPLLYSDTEMVAAHFLAPAAALQTALPTTELPVLEAAPGVGIVQITFFQYGNPLFTEPYGELAIGILVQDESMFAGYSPVYVLYLPVTTEDAKWIGIQGWGFPKSLAKIKCHYDSRDDSRGVTCKAKADGQEILTLELNIDNLGWYPPPNTVTFMTKEDLLVKAYVTFSGEFLLGTDYGEANLILGNHPIGQHLKSLGVSTSSIAHLWAPSVQNELYFPHACAPLY